MSLVNFSRIAPLASRAINPDSAELGNKNTGRSIEAWITINNIKIPAFKVFANRFGGYRGRRGNFLNFGCYLQAGVRYIITLYEDDTDKLDGTLSTAGGSGGYAATETGAIVSKINSSAMGAFINAKLVRNYTNVDFTGAGGVAASDALPLKGGRDRH
jgi:hypothetical protein